MSKSNMKVLVLDIELAPNLATVWSLWKQNIGLSQVLETSRILCFAAKWVGEKEVVFYSEWGNGQETMLRAAHALVSNADVIIGYNTKQFDLPLLNREFIKLGLPPAPPTVHLDLLAVVRKRFRFVSNKLDHVSQQLGLGKKVKHEGHELWLKVMDGESAACKRMEKYNRGDVRLTEKLYHKLRPWIDNHPIAKLYGDDGDCPNCGGKHLQARGFSYTRLGRYQRYQCTDCGAWSRAKNTTNRVDLRGI